MMPILRVFFARHSNLGSPGTAEVPSVWSVLSANLQVHELDYDRDGL